MSYESFAAKIASGGVLGDPWALGAPRFREEPIVLSAERARALSETGERVAALYDEVVRLALAEPSLLDSFFCLSPVQRLLAEEGAGLWHGIARADVFETERGLLITELNCDTPTGEAEAVVLGALAREARPELVDPSASLEASFCDMVLALARAEIGEEPRAAGIVYPTELTDDLALVRLYQRWLAARGVRTVLGSPFNLDRDLQTGKVTLLGAPVDVVVRHYKTDWWSEREPAWSDERIADAAPLVRPLRALLAARVERKVSVVNPFGAVLPQNKRAMAFMWEEERRFSADARETIRAHVPETVRLETLSPAELARDRAAWVIKSAYGAEGDEVLVGAETADAAWRETLARARPGHWVAQRRFDALPNDRGEAVNLGVFVVAGRAAGIYARAQRGATDVRAVSVPVLALRGRNGPFPGGAP